MKKQRRLNRENEIWVAEQYNIVNKELERWKRVVSKLKKIRDKCACNRTGIIFKKFLWWEWFVHCDKCSEILGINHDITLANISLEGCQNRLKLITGWIDKNEQTKNSKKNGGMVIQPGHDLILVVIR